MAMSLLERVQKLIDIAERETTPPAEAQAARLLADRLMLDNAIEEAMLDKNRPAASRTKPKTIEIPLVGDWELIGYASYLAERVAHHCNCRIRTYSSYHDGTYHAKVYGFESDIRYFEMLYVTLRLHMVGALRPGINPGKSIEDNAYILHHSGLNWFDMAKLEGWVQVTPGPGEPKNMYVKDGVRANWPTAIGKYKFAYARAIEARGEKAIRISPSGVKTFQRNAAEGYVNRINQRLREVREHNKVGAELALRVDDVNKLFRDDNPDLFKVPDTNVKGSTRKVKYVSLPYNAQAYQAGVNQANSANLNPAASPGNTRELGPQ